MAYDWTDFMDCPFCGSRPKVEHFPTLIFVKCETCNFYRGWPGGESIGEDGERIDGVRSHDAAVAGWNNRTTPEPPTS